MVLEEVADTDYGGIVGVCDLLVWVRGELGGRATTRGRLPAGLWRLGWGEGRHAQSNLPAPVIIW